MKKGTKIALVITIIYCGLSAYAFSEFSLLNTYTFWDSLFFIPGYFLGLIGGLLLGPSFVIIGQIITFFILFYILKTVINWKIYESQNKKSK